MKASGANTLRSQLSRSNLLLIALGLLSLIIYRWSLRAQSVTDITWFLKLAAIQSVFFLAATWLASKGEATRPTLIIVIVFAALFRLSILFAPPYLSDDIYRYIWDGRVQAAGINPYRYIPADPALVHLRDDAIYPHINRRDYARTMYPPAAEAVYLLTTRISESVTWMKVTMVLFEGIAMWAIAQLLGSFGLPRQRILLYAWHPLIVWEFAGSGHFDAVAIALIALALLARRRNAEIPTGFTLAGATLVKLFPIILFPAVFKRWGWKMPVAFLATVAVAYLPYLSVGPTGVLGFLFGYAGERGMISGEQFFILSVFRRFFFGWYVPNLVFVVFAFLVLIGLAFWFMRNEQSNDRYLRNALVIATAFMFLLSPHFAWYFAWLVPFLCFIPSLSVFYLTLASFLLYLTWLNDAPDQVFRINALIYIPALMLVALTIWLGSRRGGVTT